MFQMAELQGTQGPKKTNSYRLHFTKSPKLYFLVKNAYENIAKLTYKNLINFAWLNRFLYFGV